VEVQWHEVLPLKIFPVTNGHNHSTEGDLAKNDGFGVNSCSPDLPFQNMEFSWREVDGGAIFLA
jgi:hypothetical protein